MLNRRFVSAVLISTTLFGSTTVLNATGIQLPGDSIKKPANDSTGELLHFNAKLLQVSGTYKMDEAAIPVIKLNSQAVKFVDEYLAKNAGMLQKIKEKNPGYFTIMDSVFSQYGLPVEVKYLAIIESQLKPTIVSRAGAVGAWQLMPVTARNFSLKVSAKYDERKHFYKSTVAAAKYLTYLYEKFDDWLLVMAAYNGGPGTVYKAIKRSGSRNFWKLQEYLPKETRAHVKKFISTHYYYEQEGSIATLTRDEVLAYRELMTAFVAKQNSLQELKQPAAITTPLTERNTEEEKSVTIQTAVVAKAHEEK